MEPAAPPPSTEPAPSAVAAPPGRRNPLGGIVLALAVLLATALAGALALGTDGGQAWLGARLGELVSRSIAGELRVRRAAVRLDGLHLAGVEVRAPDGTRVLEVERVDAAPLLGPGLARLRVHVLSLSLVRPRALLEAPAGGGAYSLAAAFAPRSPSPDDGGPAPPFEATIDSVRIVDGALVVREAGGAPTVALRELAVDARLRADGKGAEVTGTIGARLHAPIEGAATVALDVALDDGYRRLLLRSFEARQGGARVALAGEVDLETLEAELRSLAAELPAADATRLVPSWRPGADLQVTGTGGYRGGRASAKLAVRPRGAGGLDVEGELDLGRDPPAWIVRAAGDAVSLRSFEVLLPPATVAFSAKAEGRALPPSFARFELDVERIELDGLALGPARVAGTHDDRETLLETFSVRLPGATASAGGRVAADGDAALRFDLAVGDAAVALRSLKRATAAAGVAWPDLPAIAGEARFSGRLDGPLRAPRFTGRLRSSRLEVAGVRVETLAGEASLRGLPDAPTGSLDGTVAKLTAGGEELSELRVDLRLADRRLDGTVGARSRFGRLEALLGARIAPKRDALDLDRLRLAWPGATWNLERPARVRLSPLAVDGFALSGPSGRLEGGGRYGPGAAVAARLHATGVDLAALPREVIPEAVGLKGRLDLDVDLAGSVAQPRGTVRAHLAEGAVAGIEGLDAVLAATLEGGTARGTLDASQETTKLAASFALPVDGAGPIELKARFQGLDAGRAARLAAYDRPVAGTVEGEVTVGGTFARPEATVRLAGAALRYEEFEIAGLTVDATAAGTAERPRGTGRVLIRGLAAPGRPPVDADLSLEAGADRTSLAAVARLGNVELGTASLAVAGPPESLRDRWETAPVEGRAAAAAVDVALLARLLGIEAPAAGKASLDASFGGTAAAPTLRVAVRGDELRLDRSALGRLAVEGTYAEKALAVEATVEGASGGNLRLAGRWTADLGAAGLRAGALAGLAGTPLDLALVANRFDLAFLEPLHPDVRQLEGRLDADLRIRGHAPTLDLAGTVDLVDGRLGYTNFGDLRDLSLGVTFAPDRFTLRRLTASSGGTLEAAGEGVRRVPGGPYELDVKLVARRFGIVGSDVTRAYLDTDGRLTGKVQGVTFDGSLELASTTVALPDTPSKSIQALEDHPDFVVARRGEDRAAARARAARDAAPAVRAPSVWDAAEASLLVKTKRPLVVNGTDVSVRAAVDLRIHATRSAFGLAGKVETLDGHVVVMNRRFDLERGRVVYGGREAPGNPRLDVVAAHPSSYARVTVHIGGNVEEPVMALRSEPPMPEAEIATLLATGRPQLKRGGGGVSEASGAASAIGALMSDQLKKGIASKLPVDVISFQAGEEDVFEGSTLEAGSYVTDRIYVGYQRTFTEEEDPRRNQNEVRVEYQLAPRWTLESSYGDHAVGGVDLFWTRDF